MMMRPYYLSTGDHHVMHRAAIVHCVYFLVSSSLLTSLLRNFKLWPYGRGHLFVWDMPNRLARKEYLIISLRTHNGINGLK
jgi:hypothetical protein